MFTDQSNRFLRATALIDSLLRLASFIVQSFTCAAPDLQISYKCYGMKLKRTTDSLFSRIHEIDYLCQCLFWRNRRKD